LPSGRGRRALACAVLSTASAWGQAGPTPPLGLRWSDPNGLAPLSPSELEARLSERLGHPAFDETATDPALSVTWLGTSEQCQVELRLERGNLIEGTRRIQSPSGDCRALEPALLTVAALLMEARVETEPPPQPEDTPAPAPPPAIEPEPAAREPHPPPPLEPFLLLSAGGHVSTGLAPQAELGPAAALVVTPFAHARLGLRGALFLPQEYGSSPGMELNHFSLGLLACGMPLNGSLGLGACANAGLHSLTSLGVGLPQREAWRTWAWTVGLSARAEWRLTRHWWWVAEAGVDVPTAPVYFYFIPPPGGEVVLFRQRRAAPLLFLGLTLELP
jgi:hypothetical protein